ncbi:MAG: fibronectin type III domain-containing protein [Lachnospiraceae bacterium]|nr:fibronectin type III domain-containing protein [Lachnospiraceae bacterium]
MKKCKQGVMITLFLFLFCLGLTGNPMRVDAAPRFTSMPAQTGIAKDAVTVTWWAMNADAFDVEIMNHSKESKGWEYKGRTTDNSFTVGNLDSGTNYSFKITAINTADGSKTVGRANNVKTLIDTMRNVHTESYDYEKLTAEMGWSALGAADGYEYRFKNYKGKNIRKGRLTREEGYLPKTITFDGLNANAVYTFKIRAYMTYEGKVYYTPWESVNVFQQATVKSVVKSGSKLTIKWNKMKGATGYDVYVSYNPRKGYKKVKSLGKGRSSLTIKKVKSKKISKKKKWYVYVISKMGDDESGRSFYWSSADKGKKHGYFQ